MSEHSDVYSALGFRINPDNLYQQTLDAVLDAADLLELPFHLKLILAQPKKEIIVHFPVLMDDGSYRLYKGYRIQHNDILGPYKGGMRYHPSVSLDDMKALALLMSMKCSLARLPFGGAKGGVQVDPSKLSADELMRLTRRFITMLVSNIGPDHDVLAPDMGTNGQTMGWMADTYINIAESNTRWLGQGVATGKPVDFGGSAGREKATGQGLVYVLDELLQDVGLSYANLTFSLVGYGNVGSWTGRLLTARGARLTAVLDHTGAICSPRGIDAEALAQHVQASASHGVFGFPAAEPMSADEFYSWPVDLFIPAALEQMIDLPRAQQLRCKVLAEAANAPLVPAAERHLMGRGVTVLPAILCNCGGVTVSYFEWKQNRQAEIWDAAVVDQNLRQHMVQATKLVREMVGRYHCDLRTAAYCAALEHVGSVYRIRGIFP